MNDPVAGVGIQNSGSKQAAIEASVRRLWEKIRAAAALIASLRQEKAELAGRVAALQAEVEGMRLDMSGMESELKRLREERAKFMQVGESDRFTAEEKEILKGRIRELIAKINSHL